MCEFLLKLFVKDYQKTEEPKVREQYGVLSGFMGILCNVLLFAVKLFAGILTGAISITADAFNNLSDAGSSIMTLIGFHMSGKPADTEHPFGHGRFEYLSGLFVSIAILLVGWELLKSSFQKILHPADIRIQWLPLLIMILSIGVKLWLVIFHRTLGKKISSQVMFATAADSFNDCIATSVVILSMLIFRFSGWNVDGVAGLFVAVFIIWSGIGTLRDTMQPLLGTAPNREFVTQIYEKVLSYPGIIGVHDLIVHDYGPGRQMVSLHAEVPYDVDVVEAHELIDRIEVELHEAFHCEVTIHMDPVVNNDVEINELKAEVGKLVGEIHPGMTIHDFRCTKGKEHRNLIFDVVVPYDVKDTPEEIQRKIKETIARWDPHYTPVVKIDRGYI